VNRYTFILFLLVAFQMATAQTTIVTGKVTEAGTGTPVPFATVIFPNTSDGTITDFEGNFLVKSQSNVDSLEVRYIGYVTKVKSIVSGVEQQVNFQLDEEIQTLGELIIYAGENPAFPLMRNVIDHKKQNDKRSLEAYEYEIYTKIELDMDNLSEKVRNNKVMRKVSSVLDSIDIIAGEDGQPVMPVFFSETISNYYFRNDPRLRTEHIQKTNLRGVGLTDGTTTAQIIGATFQEYNFYQNWLNIVNKEFVSPIADGWRLYYDYDLVDSLYIDDHFCYRIDFFPKSAQDLAFTGSMWVTSEEFALKRIDATVTANANLNFIEKIKIQQDLIPTDAKAWIPEKSRIVVDIAQLSPNTAGVLAKFYTSVKGIVVNKAHPISYYELPIKLDPKAQEFDQDYWKNNRHDSLSTTEENVFLMVDTLNKIPIIERSMNAAKFGATGYLKVGSIDLGPYYTFYGNNDVEGVRLGMGARTNYQMSKKWTLGGYMGYGLKDQKWKYQAYFDYVFDKTNWTNLTLTHQNEVDQVWTLTRNVSPNSLFYSLSRFGTLTQPFSFQKNRVSLFRQHSPAWSQTLEIRQQAYHPLFDFSFYPDSDHPNDLISDFSVFEVTLSTKFAKDEVFLINDNERWSMGPYRWPIFQWDYTYAIPDVLGSDLEYHRLKFSIAHTQKMGMLGISKVNLESGLILGEVPYPLLFNPIGNETPFYASFAYNLMEFFEFSSDSYVSMRWQHSFEGLILNKIPLMKKLKWRLVGNANFLYGSIRDSNVSLVQYPLSPSDQPVVPFLGLSDKPYVELGYGVENIFKFFRVDAFHRLTYLDQPNVDKFGLKFSLQFIL
jgi:hypothetical protein